jgi:ABC-type Mn2+/Zn2+ transport system ATPase subunit
MTTVLKTLREWAGTLPFWEQAALEQIMAGKDFVDADYKRLLRYLLEDKKLLEKSDESRPELKLLQSDEGKAAEENRPVKLISISNLQNVNALALNQTLTFGDELTAIFGANGSGKSGYARVIGCAGFTRGDREVMPNAFKPTEPNQIQSASIQLKIGDEVKKIDYKIGEACSDLTSFYVFDSTSVVTHLTKSNKISFSPAGLSFFTRLSQVHDECSRRLSEQANALLKPHNFNELFFGSSEIKTQIADLNDKTDLKALQQRSVLSSDDENRMRELDGEIARLKANEIDEKIKETNQTIKDLETLIRQLTTVEQKLSQEVSENFKSLAQKLSEQQEAAEKASVGQFKSDDFSQIGTQAWMNFIESAKKLAALEGKGGEYPNENDKCLLCRQNLPDEAVSLVQSFWKFLEDESQARFEETQKMFLSLQREVSAINLDCFNDQNVSRRYLERNHPPLFSEVQNFLAIAERRKRNLLNSTNNLEAENIASLPPSATGEIEKVIGELKDQLTELERINPQQKIFELSEEFKILRHRSILRENWVAIERYVKDAQQAVKIQKAIGTTRHITSKYNDLFEELVTGRYVQEFESLLLRLNCPLKVKIKTKPQKGETLKQIILETPDAEMASHKLEKILSEGEKRAVALADFLTEIALDETSRGIVLDDPVTSLDWEWKETVANCLVAEAKKRQVIVFTHDLHFLSLLKKYAENHRAELISHWIKKEGADKPGFVYLDNSPIAEREMRDTKQANAFWQQAKDAENPVETEYFLQQGFGCLRTSYEALVIYEIFGKVVVRFEERVSIDRLKDVVAQSEILEEVRQKYDLVSRYVTGHLHSDAFHAQPADCELLKREIDAFDALKGKIKSIKKQNQKSPPNN